MIKQRQFNEAMERYASCVFYKVFGHAVSVVNVTLQLYLIWMLWPFAIGMAEQFYTIALALLFTDFVNGLVHMYMDSNDNYGSFTGPLIANFHLHHKTPQYIKRPIIAVYFIETGSKVWLVAYLAGVALLLTHMRPSAQLAYLLVYIGIFSSVAEVSHYLCHSSNSNIARVLGNCGILLSKRHHAHHHLKDNVNYAFLTGWSDPLLNLIARHISPGYKKTTDQHCAYYETTNTR